MTPFTPTFDALAKEVVDMRARVEHLEAENTVLKDIRGRGDFRTPTGEVMVFGYTLNELADIIARYKQIEGAMRGKDFS